MVPARELIITIISPDGGQLRAISDKVIEYVLRHPQCYVDICLSTEQTETEEPER